MFNRRQLFGFLGGPVFFAVCLLLPAPEGMTREAWRTAAVTLLMAVWWITEAIPIPATSLLPIALFPTLSIMNAATACAPYANHLIFLFLGGFFIAISMERWNLHKRIALQTIRIVGTSPSRIVLGFMLAAAFLSMWISNTATAMMMMPIGLAVIHQVTDFLKESQSAIDTAPTKFRFGIALMLSIAYGSSIGGVGTIIGTPPNTILVGYLEKYYGIQISFFSWMLFAVPLSSVMLVLAWLYIVKIALPPEIRELPGGKLLITNEIKKLGPVSMPEKSIMFVFGCVALVWILRGFIQIGSQMMHDATVAIIGALILFLIPVNLKKGQFILDWSSAVKAPWDVLLLFGGGLALADAFNSTGLAKWIGDQLTFLQHAPMLAVIGTITLITIFLTEVTSNTAIAAMMIPVSASLATAAGIHPFGPIIGCCLAASYAFMLPVATPPNAIVFGTRYLTIPVMARIGFFMNILGTILIVIFILLFLPYVWDIDLSKFPEFLLKK
jgi:sodium-dependent dicarboxylate transporter 2/3/5